MNTQSNAMPESVRLAGNRACGYTTQTRPLYWSVRRELWENRSIYIAPLAVAAVVLFGFLISHHRSRRMCGRATLSQRRSMLAAALRPSPRI